MRHREVLANLFRVVVTRKIHLQRLSGWNVKYLRRIKLSQKNKVVAFPRLNLILQDLNNHRVEVLSLRWVGFTKNKQTSKKKSSSNSFLTILAKCQEDRQVITQRAETSRIKSKRKVSLEILLWIQLRGKMNQLRNKHSKN